MCAELARFANASRDGEAHSVVLTTDWGSDRLVKKNMVMEKDCQHGGYAPGAALCVYLVENTSAEFRANNFRRAMSCLGADVLPREGVRIERLDGRVTSSSLKGLKPNIELTVEASVGSERDPPSLTISAERL